MGVPDDCEDDADFTVWSVLPQSRISQIIGLRICPREAITTEGITVGAYLLALDRHATSKLCAILYVLGMAERVSPDRALFICIDPGLMPGMRLAYVSGPHTAAMAGRAG